MWNHVVEDSAIKMAKYLFQKANFTGNVGVNAFSAYLTLMLIQIGLMRGKHTDLSRFLVTNYTSSSYLHLESPLDLEKMFFSIEHNLKPQSNLDFFLFHTQQLENNLIKFARRSLKAKIVKIKSDPKMMSKEINTVLNFKQNWIANDLKWTPLRNTKGLIFVNTYSFKPFWDSDTIIEEHRGTFIDNKNQKLEVDFMSLYGPVWYTYDNEIKARAVLINSVQAGIYGTFILPDEDINIESVLQKMANTTMSYAFYFSKPYKIKVVLPKFAMNRIIDMKKMLIELGLTSIFQPGFVDGDNSQKSETYISDYKQIISINVGNNKAKISQKTTFDYKHDPIVVTFNRPFIFSVDLFSPVTYQFMSIITNPNEG